MTDRPGAGTDLLARVRELDAGRDHQAVLRETKTLSHDDLLARPDLGYLRAIALRAVGRTAEALELADALRQPCARHGRNRLYRQRLNLEAALKFERGDVDEAALLWQDLLDISTRSDDHDLIAKASNNLGVLHTLRGRPTEALADFSRALMAAQRLGDRRGLAQAHQNLAISFREAGFTREAHAHFTDAIGHARAGMSEDVLGRAEEERGLLFLIEGDAAMAELSARRAHGRLERIRDAAGVGEALRVLGLVSLALDRLEEAGARLRLALERARETGAVLLQAETLEALSVLELERGDDAAADQLARSAATLFERLGAAAWGERLRHRLDGLLAARG